MKQSGSACLSRFSRTLSLRSLRIPVCGISCWFMLMIIARGKKSMRTPLSLARISSFTARVSITATHVSITCSATSMNTSWIFPWVDVPRAHFSDWSTMEHTQGWGGEDCDRYDVCRKKWSSDSDDVGTLTEASLDDKIQEIDDARTQLERAREAAARVDPMEDGADVTQSVETARQRWVVLEASRATWEDAKRELLAKAEVDTFNVDDCGGFVSCYAQTDLTEAVAEQRYAR
eukprot:GEMP01073828.1.p1 GENE.GEMP01073828.1~~GEMP01073828.1.p1  ORF type:complete len:233 (+),score=61.88 GEMP01073828.1:177-875(+)